jgi:hypothetical protein
MGRLALVVGEGADGGVPCPSSNTTRGTDPRRNLSSAKHSLPTVRGTRGQGHGREAVDGTDLNNDFIPLGVAFRLALCAPSLCDDCSDVGELNGTDNVSSRLVGIGDEDRTKLRHRKRGPVS